MASPIPTDPHARMADMMRIGNRAARAVKEANRKQGIPNWYSLGGRLVNDAQSTEDRLPGYQPKSTTD